MTMYSGDETNSDEITSGPAPTRGPLFRQRVCCQDCGITGTSDNPVFHSKRLKMYICQDCFDGVTEAAMEVEL